MAFKQEIFDSFIEANPPQFQDVSTMNKMEIVLYE